MCGAVRREDEQGPGAGRTPAPLPFVFRKDAMRTDSGVVKQDALVGPGQHHDVVVSSRPRAEQRDDRPALLEMRDHLGTVSVERERAKSPRLPKSRKRVRGDAGAFAVQRAPEVLRNDAGHSPVPHHHG